MQGRKWIIAVAVAVGAAAALALLGHPGTDYRHSDFFQFWAAPRLLAEGRDPYDAADWAQIYAREASAPVATPPPPGRHVYPPWSVVILLPLAALPFELAAAVWVVAQLAAVLLALRTLSAVCGLAKAERALLVGMAAAFQPLWLIVGGGNVGGFLLWLFAAALGATLARSASAGTPVGLLSVKPHPFAVALPALLVVADRRAATVGGALVVFAGMAVATLPFGPGLTLEWLRAALDLQSGTGSNATVWTFGRVLPGGPLVAAAIAAGVLAAFIAWWRVRAPDPVLAVAGAVAVSLFVAPHGWSYDGVILLVTLAAILARVAGHRGPRRLAGLTAIACVAVVVPWVLYAVALQRGGEEWSAFTPLAFWVLLVVTSGRGARPATARP